MKYVSYEKKLYIAVLTIDRQKALNALNKEVLNELEQAIIEIEADKGIRALIITGKGKAFVAGADIAEMKDMTPDEAYEFSNLGDRVFTRIEHLPIPTIAAINGYALGGGLELALACDIRYASEKAKLGQPEVELGITPGFGGTQRLSRAIGMSRAIELITTGRTITAETAEKIGLVNEVWEDDLLMDRVVVLAMRIAGNAPVAVQESKRAIQRFWCGDMITDLEYEAGCFSRCFLTEDRKEGMAAFLEKREHEEFTGN